MITFLQFFFSFILYLKPDFVTSKGNSFSYNHWSTNW